MKKLKLIFCVMLLSTSLAGNVFAGGFTVGSGVFSFFGDVVNTIVSVFINSGEPCEGRVCTNCKPGSGGDGKSGTCRPNDN